MEVLKVSAKSNPKFCGRCVAGVVRDGEVRVQAVGAAALNQLLGCCLARGFVAPSGIDLVMVPAFTDVEIDGKKELRSS